MQLTLYKINFSANHLYEKYSKKMEVAMEDRWLSVDEIAVHLGIKRDTVYRWIKDKQMPAHRIGRLWKFQKEEVNKWARSGNGVEKE